MLSIAVQVGHLMKARRLYGRINESLVLYKILPLVIIILFHSIDSPMYCEYIVVYNVCNCSLQIYTTQFVCIIMEYISYISSGTI